MKLKLHFLTLLTFSIVTYAKSPATGNTDLLASTFASTDFIMNQDSDPDDIQRIRLQFSADDGIIRPLLLGFTPDNAATDGYDYGYDALNREQFPNDMFWNIDGQNYIIQGVGAFEDTKIYPLNVNVATTGLVKIALTGLENFDSEINVYIYDSLLNSYTQINTTDFEIVLEPSNYQNRFFITFSNDTALSISDTTESSTDQLNYLTASHEIYINSTQPMEIENVYLLNILGQTVLTWEKQEFNTIRGNELRIPVKIVPEGPYVIQVKTHNSVRNKRVIINY